MIKCVRILEFSCYLNAVLIIIASSIPDFQDSQDDEILKEAENYLQSSRTVRFDDDSDDDNDKDAEAITKAVEKRILDKYEKKAIKSAEQRGSDEEAEDEDEEDEEGGDEEEEEEPILPATGVS